MMVNSPKIEIRNLYKVFGPDPEAALKKVKGGMGKEELLAQTGHVLGLQDISINIHESAITVVMGLSGSGKSTLIRHINRLIEPTDGQVLIDNEDALLLGPEALREKRRTDLAMVFQKFALLPHRTVLDNSALPLEVRGVPQSERHKEARVWIDRVGLGGYESHYPYQLSGGMQQRVGLARALTSNSDIMLMDEAFSALDPLIRSDMQKLLLELHVELKKTIVFITHDLDEALRLADHLVILKDGKVVQQGDPQNILVNASDPYIEAFVSDINRARVLRVRSVMTPLDEKFKYAGDVSPKDTLESLKAVSEGDTSFKFRVVDGEKPIGQIDMQDLVKALVPRVSASKEQNL